MSAHEFLSPPSPSQTTRSSSPDSLWSPPSLRSRFPESGERLKRKTTPIPGVTIGHPSATTTHPPGPSTTSSDPPLPSNPSDLATLALNAVYNPVHRHYKTLWPESLEGKLERARSIFKRFPVSKNVLLMTSSPETLVSLVIFLADHHAQKTSSPGYSFTTCTHTRPDIDSIAEHFELMEEQGARTLQTFGDINVYKGIHPFTVKQSCKVLQGVLDQRRDVRIRKEILERAGEERRARIIEKERIMEEARLEREEIERKKAEDEKAKEQKRVERENQKREREERKKEREQKKLEREEAKIRKEKEREAKAKEKEAKAKEKEKKAKQILPSNNARTRTKRVDAAMRAAQTSSTPKAKKGRRTPKPVPTLELEPFDGQDRDEEADANSDVENEEDNENEATEEEVKEAETDAPVAESFSQQPKGRRAPAPSDSRKTVSRRKKDQAIQPSSTLAPATTAPSHETQGSNRKAQTRPVKSLPGRKARSVNISADTVPATTPTIIPTNSTALSAPATPEPVSKHRMAALGKPEVHGDPDSEGEDKENLPTPPCPKAHSSPIRIRISKSQRRTIQPVSSAGAGSSEVDTLPRTQAAQESETNERGKGKGARAPATAVRVSKRKRGLEPAEPESEPSLGLGVDVEVQVDAHRAEVLPGSVDQEEVVSQVAMGVCEEQEALGKGKRTRRSTPKAIEAVRSQNGRGRKAAKRN